MLQIRFALIEIELSEAFKIVLGHNYVRFLGFPRRFLYSLHFRFPLLSAAITPQLQLCLCFEFSAVSPANKQTKNEKNQPKLKLPAKLTVSYVTYVLLRNFKKECFEISR